MINRNYLNGSPVRTPYWALRTLPPFPPIAVRLLQLLSTDKFHIQQLVDLIKSDPAFTAELLRIANSSSAAFRGNVSGIRHAIAILGNQALKSLAVSLSVRIYLSNTVQDPALARVWRRSLATAALSDLLAEASPDFPPGAWDETPYVMGLLHQLGALGLMAANPVNYAAAIGIATRQNSDLRELEKDFFDIDHCQAGRWIALKWRFSPALADLAGNYDEPPSQVEFKLPDLVKIAGLLADSLGYEVIPRNPAPTSSEALALLPAAVRTRFVFTDQQLRAMVDQRIGALLESESGEERAAEAGAR